MTTVKTPWQLAWYQVRSLERLWAVLLLLLVMVPWFAVVAGTNGDFFKLGSFFFLFVLFVALLAKDRRIYRTLGLNRLGAIRQQLLISVPSLVISGAVTLPGLSGNGWIWVPVVAVSALGADIAITLSSIDAERRGTGVATGSTALMGPARSGGMARRLLAVPMLRWAIPFGAVLGLALGIGDPHRSSWLWFLLLAVGMVGLYLAPTLEVQTGTASLATWQSLGLPRRAWARVVTPIAVLAPILGLLVALVVLAVLALWNVVAWEVFHRVVAAIPGFAVLLAGVSLLVVSVGGAGGALSAGLIGGSGPAIMIPSVNLLENPTPSNVLLAAAAGGVLFLIGLYGQYRLARAVNGARITPDTRQFADS